MTNKQKILNYLNRVTQPKTYQQIAKGAKVNYNSLRRDIAELIKAGELTFS